MRSPAQNLSARHPYALGSHTLALLTPLIAQSLPTNCLANQNLSPHELSRLGRRSKRLDMPELRQQCVLIVIAVAGTHLAFFVEMPDFAELQRHPASRGLQRTEQPAVCAFPSELSNDHIPGVNVLGVGDSGRPKRPWPNLPSTPGTYLACLVRLRAWSV